MASTPGDDQDPARAHDESRRPKKRKRIDAPPPIPSIYELFPSLPQLAPTMKTLSSKHQRSNETRKLEQLARVLEIGPAADSLTRHLEAEAKRLHLVHSNARNRSPTNARRRHGASKATETDEYGMSRNDETEARDGGDEHSDTAPTGAGKSPDKARKRSKPGSRSWSRRRRLAIPIVPELDDVEVEIPSDFPSGSLLSNLHSHVSRQLAASCNTVLPLTVDEPIQPPSVLHHFEQLHAEEFGDEERCFDIASTRQWKNFKKTMRADPLSTSQKVIGWKKEWRNADRAFEDSALAAMGQFMISRWCACFRLLLKLHARDLCQNPERIVVATQTALSAAAAAAMTGDAPREPDDLDVPLPPLPPLPEEETHGKDCQVLVEEEHE
ncbi:BQ2448_4213 [Microbotryum intermedium]|uniref:BQ2448_4213 protein n=1 Tax=Microbotryum intermedium TaxID=269621 RepID=A0A238FNL4_9BASI|nr:BQ2448_4213 [Microbotryum intermedium]